MRSVLTIGAVLGMVLVLSGCDTGATVDPGSIITSTLRVSNSPVITATPTKNPKLANYQNSFEDMAGTFVNSLSVHQSNAPETPGGLQINASLAASGKQSLEVAEKSSGTDYSALSIDLPVADLVGEEAIDFSETAVFISVFIPKDSPIESVHIGFGSGGSNVMIPVAGFNVMKGRWFQEGVDLHRALENTGTTIFGNTWSEAKRIFRACDTISIVGVRGAGADPAPARFLVDDLAWKPAMDPSGAKAADPSAESLRKYADSRNVKIGSLLATKQPHDMLLDPAYAETLGREFNLLWANESGWPYDPPSDPVAENFDYSYSDAAVAIAQANGMAIKGFTGGWYGNLPLWLLDMPFDRLQPILENRVRKDVEHYKGKTLLWDVFNEVLYDSYFDDGDLKIRFRNRQEKNKVNPMGPGGWAPYGTTYSPWVDGNDVSLVKSAFRAARDTDPAALLCLNEYDNEQIGKRKAEAFYQFVKTFKEEGVPIDGVGFQMHLWIDGDTVGTYLDRGKFDTFLYNIDRNVKRYSELGVLVEFSEVEIGIRTDDIDFGTPEGLKIYQKRLEDQAYVYAGLMRIALENKNVTAFIIWEVSDAWTSVFTLDYPKHAVYRDAALFDSFYQPKPAYYAMLDVLKGG